MSRAPLLVGIVGFVVMAFIGYQARAAWDSRPAPIPGWCCLQEGSACQQKASFGACQAAQGTAFDVTKSVCDSICSAR